MNPDEWEEAAALSRTVTFEPIASYSSNASIDTCIFVGADVSIGIEEDQGQFQGE